MSARQAAADVVFCDLVAKLEARIVDTAERRAVLMYASWRAGTGARAYTFDACFAGVPVARWGELVDAVNGLWDEAQAVAESV